MVFPLDRSGQTKRSPERPAAPLNGSPTGRSLAAPGRAILAIDYGRRRMGLALSDALGVTARPLAVCTRSNRRGDLARLREICRRHGVGAILVGWPLHLDGSISEMAQETARFAERLRQNLGLPVELVDERLSSWEAQQMQGQSAPRGRSSRRSRTNLDDVAAAVILRDYLSRNRRGMQD